MNVMKGFIVEHNLNSNAHITLNKILNSVQSLSLHFFYRFIISCYKTMNIYIKKTSNFKFWFNNEHATMLKKRLEYSKTILVVL